MGLLRGEGSAPNKIQIPKSCYKAEKRKGPEGPFLLAAYRIGFSGTGRGWKRAA